MIKPTKAPVLIAAWHGSKPQLTKMLRKGQGLPLGDHHDVKQFLCFPASFRDRSRAPGICFIAALRKEDRQKAPY
jgi:hypothetical protein